MSSDAARVLVVEDEAALREAMSSALQEAGFTVHTLPSGEGFAREIELFRPDAAILVSNRHFPALPLEHGHPAPLSPRRALQQAALVRSASFPTCRSRIADRARD